MEEKNWRMNKQKSEEINRSEKYYSGISVPRKFYSGLSKESRWNDISGQLFIPAELIKNGMIIEQAHDAILILDRGKIIDANQSALSLFGYSLKNELIGLTPADLSPVLQPGGEPSSGKSEMWMKATENKEFQHFSWQHLRRDGSLIETEVTLSQLHWNSRILLVAFVRDRTGIARIEKEIRNRLGYYDLVMSSLPVDLYVAEAEPPFDRKWMSEKTGIIAGFEKDVITENSFWFSRVHPDDRDLVMNILLECVSSDAMTLEYRWKTSAGKYIWLRDRAVVKGTRAGSASEILGVLTDITHQRTNRERIRQSETFLDSIVQNIPAIIYVKHAGDLSYVRVNRSMENFLGKSGKDIIGKKDEDMFPQKLAAHIISSDRKAIDKGSTLKIPAEKVKASTGERILHTLKIPLFDSKGQPEFLLGVSVDVTEQQAVTKALKKSEEKYRILFESLPVGIAITTYDGTIIDANEKLSALFGGSKNELKQLPMQVIYASPAFRDEMIEILSREGNVSNFETFCRRIDGSIFPASLNVSPYPLYSEGALLTVITDITQQRKSEEKIRKLSSSVEQSPAAIIIMALNGVVEYVNPRFEEITGFPAGEINGGTIHILEPENNPGTEYNEMWKAIKEKTDWKGILHSRRKNGGFFWGEWSLYPLKDNFDNITHHIAVMEDITMRIRSEQDLISAKEKAEESDRLKTAFLSNISHEIRTPMNAIVGFSQLLKEKSLSIDKRNDFIGIIASKSDELLRIVDDIIEVSMIQSGQITVHNEDFNLGELFKELYETYSTKTKPGITLECDVPEGISGLNLRSDPGRIRQIMENLLGNGIKYTDRGSVRFGYKLRSDGKAIILFVEDTGIGIEPSRIPVIFQPFMQEEIRDKEARGGKGIGLTITRKLVELLGGTIRVESEKGRGAGFYIELPLSAVKNNENKNATVLPGNERDILPWEGKTILVAEDDFSNYRYVELIIQKTGATLIHCSNGEEVLEKWDEGIRPDVILMDIRMPVMDGYMATNLLRKKGYKGRIIALTAFASGEDRKKCLSSGFDDYLSKPVDSDNLLEHLKTSVSS